MLFRSAVALMALKGPLVRAPSEPAPVVDGLLLCFHVYDCLTKKFSEIKHSVERQLLHNSPRDRADIIHE